MTPDQRIADLWRRHLRPSGVPLVPGRRGRLHLGSIGWVARTVTVHGSEWSLAVEVDVAITGSALTTSVIPGTQATIGADGRPVVFADVTGQVAVDPDVALADLARRVIDEAVPNLLRWSTARTVVDRLEADLGGDGWAMDGHRLEALTVLHASAGDAGLAADAARRLDAFVSRIQVAEGASPWLLHLQSGARRLAADATSGAWPDVERKLSDRRRRRSVELGLDPDLTSEPLLPLDLDAPLG